MTGEVGTLPQVVMTHPTKQGVVYEHAYAAQLAGVPARLLTGFYAKPDGAAAALPRLLPKALGERASRFLSLRRRHGLDPARVVSVSGILPEILGRGLGRVLAANAAHDRLAARWLRRHVAPGSGTVVHGFQESCLETLRAAKALGLPTVMEITLPHTAHAILAAEHARLGLAPYRGAPAPRHLAEIAEADYIAVQSVFSAGTLIAAGVAPERIFLIGLSVDDSRFVPPGRHLAKRKFRVLFVGQLGLRKGLHHLLAAWRGLALADAELVLAGPVADRLGAGLLAELPPFCHALGRVPNYRLREIYGECDVFVLPSLIEGGATVVHEALGCGLPCIVSESAGSAVRDGIEGFIVPAGDVAMLSDRLRLLHDDRALGAAMARAAAARGRWFSPERFGHRLALMYGHIARGDRRGTGEYLDLIEH